jgi:hypothetical protein
MAKSLEKLINFLKQIDTSKLEDSDSNVLNALDNADYKDLIDNAIGEATNELIDDNGHNIWEYHQYLREIGFDVFCGDRDRFGWLTGCIQTKKGILIYG